MNEIEFGRFIKGGLGSPHSSSALAGRVAAALSRTETTGRAPRVPRAFRPNKRMVLLVAIPALLIPTAAIAGSLLTPHDVATGMPGGSAIFEGTNPKCTVVTDGIEYRCTLAHSPTVDVTSSYLGSKELVKGPDATVAGGCVGTSSDGLHWECYIGDAAVEHGILAKSLLGQPVLAPGVG